MLYRPFGKTGWQVSAIGLGSWNIGNQWGEVDDATAYATVRASLDAGMNLIDTAESYGVPNGLSEERVGRAIGGQRHQLYLVSKIGHWGERTGQGVPKTTVDMIRLCAHASLHRLRTDYHDVLLCHEANLEDPSIYLAGFEALIAEGKLRCYGISTDSLEVLKRFNVDGRCAVVEVNYSLLNRKCEAELLPYCAEQGIAVLLRGPVGQGLLSGRYTAETVFDDLVRQPFNAGGARREQYLKQLAAVDRLKSEVEPGQAMITKALRYVISHSVAPVAIPGAKSPEQAITNAAAGDCGLCQEERAALAKLVGD